MIQVFNKFILFFFILISSAYAQDLSNPLRDAMRKIAPDFGLTARAVRTGTVTIEHKEAATRLRENIEIAQGLTPLNIDPTDTDSLALYAQLMDELLLNALLFEELFLADVFDAQEAQRVFRLMNEARKKGHRFFR